MKALPRRFFERSTVEVARALIGVVLVHDAPEGRTAGRIVETEAYLATGDPASHSFRGPTRRNAAMYGPAGTAYVYLIYGMHLCLNVVTAARGVGEAVLIRALEPVQGLELMGARRGRSRVGELCSGPGKLTMAMGITRAHDRAELSHGPLRLVRGTGGGTLTIVSAPRVGIRQAAELPLRFLLAECRFVSRC